jgi:uncharacterized short protein YbdD (DUF466 family)
MEKRRINMITITTLLRQLSKKYPNKYIHITKDYAKYKLKEKIQTYYSLYIEDLDDMKDLNPHHSRKTYKEFTLLVNKLLSL